MPGKTRTFAAVVCLALGAAATGEAQQPGNLPNIPYVVPGDKAPTAPAPAATPAPPTGTAAPLGWGDYRLPLLNEASFPPLAGDHLLDEPEFPPPGWYTAVDVDAVAAHFKNRLVGPVPLSATRTDIIHVPGAELDWTAAPRVELGYRLPRGWGELLISYRSLVTQGTETLAPSEGGALLHSRLNTNEFDIDYGNYHALAPLWDMRWRVGVQVSAAYYDAQSAQPITAGGIATGSTQLGSTNNFVGAGPHAGLEIWRHFDCAPALALYLAADGTTPWGELHQSYQEIVTNPVPVGGASRNSLTQGVGILGLQAGISWTPPWWHAARITVGYQFEGWWELGRDDNTGSIGSLTEHGVFLRAQFSF